MKHLSGLDATFLHLETPEMPMHVGSLNVLDLPKGYTGDFYEDAKKFMASRIHLADVFTRKLALMPFDMTNPVWVEDNDIDLDYHVLLQLPVGSGLGQRDVAHVVVEVDVVVFHPDRVGDRKSVV